VWLGTQYDPFNARCPHMSDTIRLRNVEPDDLPIFFEQQLDRDAARMAGFPSRNRAAFDSHWAKNILGNPTAVTRTILLAGKVVGNIGSWRQDALRFVGYWIGKEYWGRGIATQALASMLRVVTDRPIRAHVAKHNLASIRVLEKCGFKLEDEHGDELTFVLLSDLRPTEAVENLSG